MIIYKDYNIKNLTSLSISYNARLLFEVIDEYEIYILVIIFKELDVSYHILSGGSKVLFSSMDINTPIIYINKKFSKISYFDNKVLVSSGYLLKELIIKLANKNLGGFHTLYALPACIGGITYMNAGIKEYEISKFIDKVICLDKNGKLHTLNNFDCDFSYRKSVFQKKEYIILFVLFKLDKIDKKIILKDIKDSLIYRKHNQDNNNHTCGSLFKNNNNIKAYELINKSNSSNLRVNGAFLSAKHANFLICDNATCYDVINLIDKVKNKVKNKYNITLQLELNIL